MVNPLILLLLITKALSVHIDLYLYCLGNCKVYVNNTEPWTYFELKAKEPPRDDYPKTYTVEIDTDETAFYIESIDYFLAGFAGNFTIDGKIFYIRAHSLVTNYTYDNKYYFYDRFETRKEQDFYMILQQEMQSPLTLKIYIPSGWELDHKDLTEIEDSCYSKVISYSQTIVLSPSELFDSLIEKEEIYFPIYEGEIYINEIKKTDGLIQILDGDILKITLNEGTKTLTFSTKGTKGNNWCQGYVTITKDGCNWRNPDNTCGGCLDDKNFLKVNGECIFYGLGNYYDINDEQVHQCYETCETCSSEGTKDFHNCLTCKEEYPYSFRPDYRPFNSYMCFSKCSDAGLMEHYDISGKIYCGLSCNPENEYTYNGETCINKLHTLNFQLFIIKQTNTVVHKCPSSAPFISIEQGQMFCNSQTSAPKLLIDSNDRIVTVSSCPSNYYIIDGNICKLKDPNENYYYLYDLDIEDYVSIADCSHYGECIGSDNHCEKCNPDDSSQYFQHCRNNEQNPYFYKQKCYENCPSEAPKIDLDTMKCVLETEKFQIENTNMYMAFCNDHGYNLKYDLENKKCVPNCKEPYFENEIGDCVLECKGRTPFLAFKDGKKICVSKCEGVIKNGQCVENCNVDTDSSNIPFSFDSKILDCSNGCKTYDNGIFCLAWKPGTSAEKQCDKSCNGCIGEEDPDKKCVECKQGYYPNSEETTVGYLFCYNQIEMGSYYLDNDKWKPCHASCSSCSAGPVGEFETNCDECKSPQYKQNPFKLSQCYREEDCNGKFYFDNSDFYFKCVTGNKCPDDYQYLIKGTNQCIDKCKDFKNCGPNCQNDRSCQNTIESPCTNKTLYSLNYECVESCDDGFYENKSEHTCVVCDKSCKTCNIGEESNGKKCVECKQGYYPNSEETTEGYLFCYNQSEMGSYYLDNNKWKPCHASCVSCSAGPVGEFETNCDECKSDYTQNPFKSTQCYKEQDCNEKFYFDNSDSYFKCVVGNSCSGDYPYLISETNQCIHDCIQFNKCGTNCQSDPNCLSTSSYDCPNKTLFYSESTCVTNCGQGYTQNTTTYSCDPLCDDSCASCKGGEANRDKKCFECKQGYYPNSEETTEGYLFCYNQSQMGSYYVDKDSDKWVKCHASCASCSAGPLNVNEQNCDDCLSPYKKNPVKPTQCYLDQNCNFFYYDLTNSYYNCVTGNKCPDDYQYLIKGTNQCIDKCKDFKNCGPNCQNDRSCQNTIESPCTNKTLYSLNYECVESCDDGFYENKSEHTCVVCDKSCKTCNIGEESNGKKCVECKQGYYPNSEETTEGYLSCYNESEMGSYYLDNDKWKPCHASCVSCSAGPVGEFETNCDECKSDYTQNPFKSTQCYKEQDCNDKFYFDNSDSYFKCVVGNSCSGDYPYLISETNQCVEDCNNHPKCGKNCQLNFNCPISTGNCPNKTFYSLNKECVTNCGQGYTQNTTTYSCDPLCDDSCASCKGGEANRDKKCFECKQGYYPNSEETTEGYLFCYNQSEMGSYYLDNDKWKPCHASCASCSAGPVGEFETNCDECKSPQYKQNPFKLSQCYREEDCNGKFYFDNSDYYFKCVVGNSCPDDYPYLIKGTQQCINDCIQFNKCGENCQTSQNCEAGHAICDKQFYYYDLTCVITCPSGYTENSLTYNCDLICDEKCATCDSAHGNDFCQTCNTNKGYYPFPNDSNNIPKNCTKQVDNYYINEGRWEKCHSTCKSCSGAGSENAQNCESCLDPYIPNSLNTSQCYQPQQCTGNFYYQSTDSYFICTNSNQCPTEYPYTITGTKQCIDSCENYNGRILYSFNFTCVESCPSGYQVNKSTNNCDINTEPPKSNNTIDNVQNTLNNFIFNAFNDPLTPSNITTEEFVIQKYPSKNPPPPTKDTTSVDLSQCIEILKKQYQINEVIIIKVDINRNDSAINQVEYKLYDMNGNELNLTYCKDIPMTINYIISEEYGIDLALLAEMQSDSGVDLLDSNDPFYQDICVPHANENGVDMVLADRQKDIYPNISLCDTGCTYDTIDVDTMQVSCKCEVKTEMSTEVTEPEKPKDMASSLYSKTNIALFKCYKVFLNLKNWKKNVGFYLIGLMYVINIYLFFHTFCTFDTKRGMLTVKLIRGETPPKRKTEAIDTFDSGFLRCQIFTDSNLVKDIIIADKVEITPNSRTNFDALSYRMAIEYDPRSMGKIVFDTFSSKIDLLQVFCYPEPFSFFTITLSGYLFACSLEFTLNSFIFSDGVVSENYHSNGEMSMISSILLSSIANIISNAITYMLFKLIAFENELEFISKEKMKELPKLIVISKYFKYIRNRFIIYFTIELIFEAAMFYYIIIFCVIYKNSQVNWIKDCLTGIGIDLAVSLGISIIVSVMRYIAIKKRNEKLYYMAMCLRNFKCIISL